MDDLQNRFEHHPPSTEAVAHQHGAVRQAFLDTATFVDEQVPDGREKSLAITKLEEAMYWANAGIARNQ